MDEKIFVSLTGWLKKFGPWPSAPPKIFSQTFFQKIKCTNFLNIRYAVRKSYPINRVRFPNGVTNV